MIDLCLRILTQVALYVSGLYRIDYLLFPSLAILPAYVNH